MSNSKVVGAGVEVLGKVGGSYVQYKSIQDRAAGQTSAANVSAGKLINNQEQASAGLTVNQDTYVNQLTGILRAMLSSN